MSKPSLKHQFKTTEELQSVPYSKTREQYMVNIEKFSDFCKAEYGCRTVADCEKYVQEYEKHLEERGLKPDTIHTYLAPVCRVYHMNMSKINKPLRIGADATRSRGTKAVDERSDAKDSCSPRLSAFADEVYIRRAEYGELRGRNFKQDESGYWCVEVECGKGGKYQLQRIAPDKVEFIRSYFEKVGHDEFIFKKSELVNKIDLHAKRAAGAKMDYFRYLKMFEEDPTTREQVYKEIVKRWRKYNKKNPTPPTWEEVNEPYFLRGKNKEAAIVKGYAFKMERLALLAVSVFHLSHWRVDDTVTSYVLA